MQREKYGGSNGSIHDSLKFVIARLTIMFSIIICAAIRSVLRARRHRVETPENHGGGLYGFRMRDTRWRLFLPDGAAFADQFARQRLQQDIAQA
jgi:hypothetical protein